jgi:coenzyme Q-binding protein COQ10
MPRHREKKILPYTQEQMFDLVADIGRYDEFLPWCVASRVRSKGTDRLVVAELVIGFKMFRERFVSQVHLNRAEQIKVDYLKGPMKHLMNEWHFRPALNQPDHCEIEFFVSFEFKNPVLQKIVGVLFSEAFRRMVHAFEMRAKALYGDSQSS